MLNWQAGGFSQEGVFAPLPENLSGVLVRTFRPAGMDNQVVLPLD